MSGNRVDLFVIMLNVSRCSTVVPDNRFSVNKSDGHPSYMQRNFRATCTSSNMTSFFLVAPSPSHVMSALFTLALADFKETAGVVG